VRQLETASLLSPFEKGGLRELHVNNNYRGIYYTLRIAIAMCFIGHGAFGIITKQVWCNYFAVCGIGEQQAYTLMPVVGIVDILMGAVMLFYPSRFIALWLVIWGLFTALLRPLSGEPFAEFIERAGNYGAPFAFLLLSSAPLTIKNLFSAVPVPDTELSVKRMNQLTLALKIIVFLLLAGHGWLNLIEKKGLIAQYSRIGFDSPYMVARIVGTAEIIAAFSVLIKPIPVILLTLFIWKMATEVLYPSYTVFEWIERGGSYGSILALWFIVRSQPIPSVGGVDASVRRYT
jgi:uncharacterized membrane protein YphA (DoxX/SURF4 family)